jgi:Flp pilus assembly secretin CpaC
MNTAVRTMLLAVALPLATGAAAAPVCPVKPHHAVHAHKAVVVHRTAGGVGVTIDQARLVSFPEPVKTVYVGNPWIADVSMVDPQHAFVLGKTFGVTNMIALSADGKLVSNQQVTVLNNAAAVTVNLGAAQFNYMCTHVHCESSPRPGDPQVYAQNSESVATTHENTASGLTTATPMITPTIGATASNQ